MDLGAAGNGFEHGLGLPDSGLVPAPPSTWDILGAAGPSSQPDVPPELGVCLEPQLSEETHERVEALLAELELQELRCYRRLHEHLGDEPMSGWLRW